MDNTQRTCLLILTTIAVGFSLYFLQTVLLPFVIAFFIVIGCNPILDYLGRLGIPRLIAFGLTFCAGTLMVLSLCYMIFLSVVSLSENLPAYQQRLNAMVSWYDQQFGVSDTLGGLNQLEPSVESEPAGSESLESQPPAAQGEPQSNEDSSAGADDGSVGANKSRAAPLQGGITNIPNQSEPPDAPHSNLTDGLMENLQSLMVSLAGALSSLLSYSILILIFVYFLLFGNSMHTAKRPEMLVRIEGQIRKFLVIKTLISAATGFVFGFVLWLFGVPLAIVFGMLAFLLNYIPNIGPLVAIVLPVPFLVLNAEIAPPAAITCFVLISIVQFVSGNVIETNLMGKSFDVSPVVLLLALMFFGLVWGIVGMFVATPLISIAKIVLEGTPQGKGIAELIAGRWGDGEPGNGEPGKKA